MKTNPVTNLTKKLANWLAAGALATTSLAATANQLVVLDFDTGTDDVIDYTPEMRAEIQSEMENHYEAFDITFTQDLNPVGDASRIVFNSGGPGGLAEGIDFKNLNKNDNAVVNVGGILAAPSRSEIIGASAGIGSHELGHLLGLRHADSMGPIGTGLPSSGTPPRENYAPNYPGPQNADETNRHIMASPASVGSSLGDLSTPSWLSERSAIKLAVAEDSIFSPEPSFGSTATGTAFLTGLDVPNTLVEGVNAGKEFVVSAFTTTGSIGNAGGTDEFTVTGEAGDVLSIEVMSVALEERISNTIDSTVTVTDSTGSSVPYFTSTAFNDDEFETTDSHLIDLMLPADGDYTITVATFSPTDTGSYEIFGQTFEAIDPVMNQAPTALPQSVMTSQGNAVGITLSGTDPEEDPLTFMITDEPTDGELSGTAPNLTYTPDEGFGGSDSFEFTVSDGENQSLPATVMINVTAVNQAPFGIDQEVSTLEDTPLDITLTGSDPEMDELSFNVVAGPANGQLTGTAPNLTYTPSPDFNGFDSLSFTVSDGINESFLSSVDIDVLPVNDAPVALPQMLSVEQNSSVDIVLTATDIDSDSTELIFTVTGSGPANGELEGIAPNLTYTPNDGFTGVDSFTFIASEEGGDRPSLATGLESLEATITINVNGGHSGNTPPVAEPQMLTTAAGFPIAIVLVGNDSDGDDLTFSIESQPDNGMLAGMAPSLMYTPGMGFTGLDSFTFTVSDALSTSEAATVSITVVDGNADVACGRPTDLDRTVDRGSFLWRDCTSNDALWFFQVNGGGAVANQTSSGTFQAIGGLQDLQLVSIESVDNVDTTTEPNSTWFDLKVKRNGVDRLEFIARPNTCFQPGSLTDIGATVAAEPVFLGQNRVPLAMSSFSLDTGFECQASNDADGDGLSDEEEGDLGTNPLVPDTDGGGVNDGTEVSNNTDPLDPSDDLDLMGAECFAPTIDSSSEAGLFLWKACDGSNAWSLLVSGGGGSRVIYSGDIFGGRPTDIVQRQINRNDRVELGDFGLNYRLIVRNAGKDRFDFTPAEGSCIQAASPDTPIFLGENKVPAPAAVLSLDDPAGPCTTTFRQNTEN